MKGSAMLAVQACALALAVLLATPGVAQETALSPDGQNFIMQRMARQNIQAFDRQAHRPMTHARVCSAAAEEGHASCHAHVVHDETGRPFAATGPSGYSPADLRSAYSITSDQGFCTNAKT